MINIGLFLEDIGHQNLIEALIRRAASEITDAPIEIDVRNASGGKGRMAAQFEDYLRDYGQHFQPRYDIVVVARDTDCQGRTKTRRELEQITQRAEYVGRVVYAVPEPYIETWYLADPSAVQSVAGSHNTPPVPGTKCNPTLYKGVLASLFRETGIEPALGGIEYAVEITEQMDVYQASKNVPSLGQFLDDFRSSLVNCLEAV